MTAPCYNIEERLLNRKRRQRISGVDLGAVDGLCERARSAGAAVTRPSRSETPADAARKVLPRSVTRTAQPGAKAVARFPAHGMSGGHRFCGVGPKFVPRSQPNVR